MRTLSKLPALLLASALLLLGAGRLSAQSMLYGLTFFDNELISINTATGEGTLIANLSANVTGYGLAFRGSHLYTFDPNTDGIREINTTTGAVGPSINIGVGNLTGEGDLAFRSDGIGFLTSALNPDFSPSNDLFRFDLTLGTSVRIGSTAIVLDAMAFYNNILYAIGQEGSPSLYIVDQNTGGLTAIGALGIPLGSPFSALTLGTDGQFYAALDDRLYRIDRLTGAATAVDPTITDAGFGSISGLAAPVAITPVPEPSTYGAIGAASLMGLAWLKRRRAQSAKVVS